MRVSLECTCRARPVPAMNTPLRPRPRRSPIRLLAWIATAAVALLLVVPLPAAATAGAPAGSDKTVHVVLFGALAVVWRRALSGPAIWLGLAVFAGVTLYGGGLELVQSFLPYRSCELADFIADGVGAAVALVATAAFASRAIR